MPITRGAIKKLRQDKKRRKWNSDFKKTVKDTVKDFNKSPNQKKLGEVFSSLDRAVKKNIFHKNKAARMKSSASKLILKKSAKK